MRVMPTSTLKCIKSFLDEKPYAQSRQCQENHVNSTQNTSSQVIMPAMTQCTAAGTYCFQDIFTGSHKQESSLINL